MALNVQVSQVEILSNDATQNRSLKDSLVSLDSGTAL